jgi:NAD(P)-dependent dehydrogenase (short-subunit alcohol dehydrogenase family)
MNIIITGGYSGIGLELTKILFQEGHKLGLIIRDKKKNLNEIDPLFESKDIDFFYGDLSKDDEILDVIKRITDKWNTVDVLFNNAGLLTDKAYYSAQGNEMQFEVNTMAPYILTYGLKVLLEKSHFSTVITTSTYGMHKTKKLDIEELKRPKRFVKLLGSYKASKFASVLMMNHFAKEYPKIMVRMVDPGANKTKMTSGAGMPKWLILLRNLFFSEPKKGAEKLYSGAFNKNFTDKNAVYITNNKIKPTQKELSLSEVVQIASEIVVSRDY